MSKNIIALMLLSYLSIYFPANAMYPDSNLNSKEFSILEKKAKQGDSKSQYEIGMEYWSVAPRCTPSDSVCEENDHVQNAEIWLLKSANQGYAPAEHALSDFYMQQHTFCYSSNLFGFERKPEPKKAKRWLDRAFAHGYMDNPTSLGSDYLYGENGHPKDAKKALSLFQKAKDQGSYGALYWLGRLYEEGGTGVNKDLNKAINFYQQAAKLNDKYAIDRLINIYKNNPATGNPIKQKQYQEQLDYLSKEHVICG